MKKKSTYISISLALGCFFTLFSACSDSEGLGGFHLATTNPVRFLGTLNQEELATRALTIDNITYEAYPTPIYIRMDVDEKESQTGIYSVKPGYDGRLTGIDDRDLNWLDSDSGHTFYGWTMPWKKDTEPANDEYETVSFIESDYKNEFKLNEGDYFNCSVLEKFIGTKAGPVNYRYNGEYVELQFQHLVSKIYIASINLTTNDGSTWQNITGEMTIYGLPNKGYFYRHPSDGKAPYVKNPLEMENIREEDFSDLTYTIGRSSAIYLCPNVNINELQFKIKLTWPSQQGVEGEYYGDFSSISIARHPNTDEWDKDKNNTTLYAGEILTLNLALRQGNVTGVTASIGKWTDKNVGTSGNYPHPGVYTDAQFADLFNSDKTIDELYSLYGEDEGRDKVFHLYNDVSLGSSISEIPDDYIFDGMGHTITVDKLNPDSYKNFRDIYITDGEHTIYIDSEGKIYVVNSDGSKTETGALGDLKGSTYNIDLATGTIK